MGRQIGTIELGSKLIFRAEVNADINGTHLLMDPRVPRGGVLQCIYRKRQPDVTAYLGTIP